MGCIHPVNVYPTQPLPLRLREHQRRESMKTRARASAARQPQTQVHKVGMCREEGMDLRGIVKNSQRVNNLFYYLKGRGGTFHHSKRIWSVKYSAQLTIPHNSFFRPTEAHAPECRLHCLFFEFQTKNWCFLLKYELLWRRGRQGQRTTWLIHMPAGLIFLFAKHQVYLTNKL